MLDELGSVDWPGSDPMAVGLGASRLLRDADRLKAIGLLALAEHTARGGVRADGDSSAGDWAARHTKTSPQSGARAAAAASRLKRAPKTAKAAAEGRLSTEQADKLASTITDANAGLFAEREADLIDAAAGSLDDATKVAAAFREETGERPEDRAARLWARRSAACWDDDEGMTQGRQSLAGDSGAEFKAAFDAFVAREFAGRDPQDRRTNTQKRADGMATLARYALAGLHAETPGRAPRAVVTVLVRYEDLVDHRLVHEGGWRISLDPSGRSIWTAPDGRTLIGQKRGTGPPGRRRSAGAPAAA